MLTDRAWSNPRFLCRHAVGRTETWPRVVLCSAPKPSEGPRTGWEGSEVSQRARGRPQPPASLSHQITQPGSVPNPTTSLGPEELQQGRGEPTATTAGRVARAQVRPNPQGHGT